MDRVQTRDRETAGLEGPARMPAAVPPGTAPEVAPAGTTWPAPAPARADKTTAEFVAGGSMSEAVAGIGAIVLAIVALAGVYPTYLGPITAIVVGGGLLLQGVSVAARTSALIREAGDTGLTEAELGGGMTAEMLGGVAGITLGILALVGVVPVALLSVAVLVFGAALLLGAAANRTLNYVRIQYSNAHPTARRIATNLVSTANGAQVLVGLAAVTLGIIALAGTMPLTLDLVALLAVGVSNTMSGSALSGKMFSMISRS